MASRRKATTEGPALVLVLGDQLSTSISSLAAAGGPSGAVVLMAEVHAETTYVRHHRRKIAFVLSAMRHFAASLREAGWTVDYVRLDDPSNTGSLPGELARAVERHAASRVIVTQPGRWRLQSDLESVAPFLGVPLEMPEDDRFLCSRARFEAWARGRRTLRMEWFYREMRRAHGVLMEGDEPAGGRWNFDAENRRFPRERPGFPEGPRFEPDAITREVLDLVASRFVDHPGDLEPFGFAVTRRDALAALARFVEVALPRFGDWQDAMLDGEPFLFHSVLSPYLNVGLLDPGEACRAAEVEYREGRAPLAAVEGFVRQVLGWREYVRGIYWMRMPGYERSNELGATRPLPSFYWTGDTSMACVSACVKQTMREAYAHHIQRLMVTGLFALLAGVDPHELHEWYLAVYVDAFEWVELPNTLGMSQFADGGLLASKPYAASGAYLDRMSDYCDGCVHDVKAKTGPGACPFNALYWHFVDRHLGRLRSNPRTAQACRTWERMEAGKREDLLASANAFLATLG